MPQASCAIPSETGRTPSVVILNFAERVLLARHAGEMKKSMFAVVQNYLLPEGRTAHALRGQRR